MEYIESYFNEELNPEQKTEFEQRIIADPGFAGEVAFYISSKQAANVELIEEKQKFKELYAQYKESNPPGIGDQKPTLVRQLLPWAAAAAVIVGVLFGWNLWFKPTSTKGLAEKYIKENFQALPVTMGAGEDSLQAGLRLYNEGKFTDALKQFEDLAAHDTSFIDAKKYAGITALRLEQYDKAINYFSQLENYTRLYANPGKFYHALSLMKRNRSGDLEIAKQLLQQVVEENLEGRENAELWLKKW